MKKNYLTALLVSLLFVSAYAGDGDTLVVQGHDDVTIQTDPSVGHTLYPVWSVFPAAPTAYRRVLAYMTFNCAPGLDCGEWDYLNHIYIGRTGGVSGDSLGYELGRFITPYGLYWNASDNWEHGWWLDLTDWGSLLHDSVQIIYKHSGYEAMEDRGWLVNIKYYIIEGAPVRDIVRIDTLWNGSFQYGNEDNSIENSLNERTITLAPETEAARLWVMQTGHGSDNNEQCGEFCAKTRYAKLDGETIHSRLIWKECGFNSLFPQAGTWLNDRANWCPGQTVQPDWIELTGLTPGSVHTLNLDMEPYTATADFGNMVFAAYLFEYKTPNEAVDATLDAIVAPSKEYEFGRYNPVCGQPIIIIRNSGSTPLTSLDIEYGISGGDKVTYSWTGNLAFLESDTITLTQEQYTLTEEAIFEVELRNPNGEDDPTPYDNKAGSIIKPTEVLPSAFVVEFRTNKANKENSYKIVNSQTGDVIYEKTSTSFPEMNTLYRDTVALEKNTCYRFEFSDEGTPIIIDGQGLDISRDGLSYWYWDALYNYYSDPESPGYNPAVLPYIDNNDGRLIFKAYPTNATLKNFTGSYSTSRATIQNGDFGTKIIYYFSTDDSDPLSAAGSTLKHAEVSIYPNPSADGVFSVNYYMPGNQVADITVSDIRGSVLFKDTIKGEGGIKELNLQELSAGVYFLRICSRQEVLTRKMVIQ